MATAIGFDPTWTSATVFPYTLGAIYSDQSTGYLYRCVQVVTAAAANGTVMCRYSSPAIGAALAATGIVIGANRTTALAGTPAAILPVGVAVGAILANSYGFVMVCGIHTNVLSGTSTLGRMQMAITTNDSCGDASASIARTEGCIGMCLVATSGGRAVVDVRCLGA